jgi:malyl-CoA/(S)-citramalyl-CoA lyase
MRDIPNRPARMIHFFDPSNPRMATKVPDLVRKVDVLLANLEDAIEVENKVAAREGLIKIARDTDFGDTQFWVRVNSLDSPWCLDDVLRITAEVGDAIDVMMIPKVEGPWDMHFMDQLLAQLEAKHGIKQPILLHAILETALGVANVEEIVAASPRMQGISLGPADLAASRRMKTTRVGGGHPGYLVRVDPDPDDPDAPRATAQQDLWHYTMARMVDACAATGALPFYGPFGAIDDSVACEDQFRNAFLMGCVGAWSLHPRQIDIARRVFSPPPEEVAWAKKVIEAMGHAHAGRQDAGRCHRQAVPRDGEPRQADREARPRVRGGLRLRTRGTRRLLRPWPSRACSSTSPATASATPPAPAR